MPCAVPLSAVAVRPALTGCADLVVGQAAAGLPAPVDVPAGDFQIVGASDDAIDQIARNALADLNSTGPSSSPTFFGQDFTPLPGGYYCVDPDDSTRANTRDGHRLRRLEPPDAVEDNAFYCQLRLRQLRRHHYDRAFLDELAGRATAGSSPRW